ncbi:DCC1-like thiol-disulfide oxidoreductase family protein [Riemerella anatipestifer]|nr:DCC1-like thiol-disulfide oxidoreductase family protein [Riemerella anatipestifer]
MNLDSSKYYLFYDGDCGVCNRWVQWVLKNDKNDNFRFVALQSSFGQSFLKDRNLPTSNFSTLYLWKPNAFYLTKSDAVIKIGHILGGKFSLLNIGKVVPTFVRNKMYDLVAKNRMNIAGKYCLLLSEEEQKKFIK